MTNPREDQIRRRAHEIWEREGRPHGRHEEHWRLATEEISREAGLDPAETAQMMSLAGEAADPAAPAPARRRRSGTPADAPAKARKPRDAASAAPDAAQGTGSGRRKAASPDTTDGAAAEPKRRRTAKADAAQGEAAPPQSAPGRKRRSSGAAEEAPSS